MKSTDAVKMQFYDPMFIELLKKQMHISPSTAHKMMNPFCGKCVMERGKQFIAQQNKQNPS